MWGPVEDAYLPLEDAHTGRRQRGPPGVPGAVLGSQHIISQEFSDQPLWKQTNYEPSSAQWEGRRGRQTFQWKNLTNATSTRQSRSTSAGINHVANGDP